MPRIWIAVVCLLSLGAGPALAEGVSGTAPAPAPNDSQTAPDRRAESSVPQSGVIRPAPDAGRGRTVTPPHVDPAMAIPPPGTPGGDPKVIPK